MRTAHAIVLVYAADATLRAIALDVARKLVGARGCTLCDITHGALGERRAWRRARRALGVPVETWHRDDAPREIREAAGDNWPAVLARVGREVIVLLEPAAIARCAGDPDALVRAVRDRARELAIVVG